LFEPVSYAWSSQEEAESFLSIAKPELGFIPSQLPKKREG
jgi:hypothetical protein